jgi:Uma2 family endonuclease
MSASTLPTAEVVDYPESDGEPLAESTLQLDWLVLLFDGLEAQFRDAENILVTADLFWYPVKGDPKTVIAADVMVAFGRPKQPRRSYLQWNEEGIAPQVTFEIRSPSNTRKNLQAAFKFYERYGVEEYYLYDPWSDTLEGWRRSRKKLSRIGEMNGWVSPRLGIRFEMQSDGLHVFGTDGQEFLMSRERARRQEQALEKGRQIAATLEFERQKLAAKLRELGVDPDSI